MRRSWAPLTKSEMTTALEPVKVELDENESILIEMEVIRMLMKYSKGVGSLQHEGLISLMRESRVGSVFEAVVLQSSTNHQFSILHDIDGLGRMHHRKTTSC